MTFAQSSPSILKIQSVVPPDKADSNSDILLKDNDVKLERTAVASFINDYFINVGKVDTQLVDINSKVFMLGITPDPDVTAPYSLSEVSEQEVLRVIKSINTQKSSGLENINSNVIKITFELFKPEVTFMYNLSIGTTQFPGSWKEALVIPIPKKGNLTKVQNYRPILFLPLPGKIMEKLVHHHLANPLENGSFLAEEQHGFRKAHSTVHAKAQLTDHISKKLDVRL